MAVLVLSGLLADNESESIVREVEAFKILSDVSSINRFVVSDDEDFEAVLLGHHDLKIAPGPLTVAALGWHPPERSTHFHVSLLSLDGDVVKVPTGLLEDAQRRELESALTKLNSKSMTMLMGEGFDYALVWERRIDMLTHSPEYVGDHGLKASLPEGDFENDLRRLIDDSVNILSELELNQRRIDAGELPVNLAWPWGHGERVSVPNQALRFGYPWNVLTCSLSLRGYARLSGLSPSRIEPRKQLNERKLGRLVETIKKEPRSMVMIDFKEGDDPEEKAYTLDSLGRGLLLPLMEDARERKLPFAVVATGGNGSGLIARWSEKASERDMFPFDERSLHEKGVVQTDLAQLLGSQIERLAGDSASLSI